MSLRLRLTLLYTGLMATALLLFSLLLYGVLRWTFLQTVDTNLQGVASDVAFHFQNYGTLPPLNSLADRSTFVLVRTAESSVARSGNFTGLFPLPRQAMEGDAVFMNDMDTRGAPYRLYTLPVLDEGRSVVFVQVAHSVQLIDSTIFRLRFPVGVGTVLFVALGGLAAWWVALRAIAPINSVALAAKEIGDSGDLSYRVPSNGPNDEVGLLVTTFNGMLDQLQAVYTRLAAAVDAQQRFVADASHELRTPLTIIRGNVDYLQKAGKLDPEAIADISSEAERMSQMVEELLAMARADAGQAPSLGSVLLGPLVTEVCRKAQALPHQVEFRTELPRALDRISVLAHAEWLTRALLILIDNAFKYSSEGTVTVRAGRQAEGVVIQVTDTGMGIAREDLPHIFERFYRADRARVRGGTGLGLAIARWVAEVHGGRLSAQSEAGQGSTFSLWLPLDRGDQNSKPGGDS